MARPNTQKKRNFHGGKKSFKPDEKDERISSRKCNDPSWYIREGQLAKDVASFSFNTALGNPITLEIDNVGGSDVVGNTFEMPGIMRLHTIPSVGFSENGSSPINLAAKNLYSWVRHANSGHSNYDSPDLMMYIVAMDSLYAFIWHLQRAYGTARVYSQKNRYIGDALLTAMGFIPSDVRANLANFRSYINMLIVKASAFCTPTSMSLFSRHTWMYQGIYKDEDVEKSQFYLYVPDFLYAYNETSGGPGFCEPVACLAKDTPSSYYIENQTRSIGGWEMIGDYMISKLVSSEDINIMSGDIRKAYGENGIWRIGLVPEDYACVPIYSGEVLDQIHNTVFTGYFPRYVDDYTDPTQLGAYSIKSFEIYQDPLNPDNPILCKPQFAMASGTSVEHICDMEENEPSPERVLVGTRNMIHGTTTKYTVSGNSYFITEMDSFGSDLCLFADVLTLASNGGISYYPMYSDHRAYVKADIFTRFHKAPLTYKFDDTSGQHVLEEVLGEVGDFILMDKSDIDKMHQSAILSMLGVPV